SEQERHEEELAPELADAIRRLPREVEPARDLWPGIQARLHEESAPARADGRDPAAGGHGPWRWLAIAAGIAVVAVSLAYGIRRGGGELPTAELRLRPPIATDSYDAATASSSDDVMQALEARIDELDPATVATIKENLQVIDQALDEIRRAIAEDPSNRQLQQLQSSGERQRGEVLRRAAVLAGSA
ncbi:MAG: hypothetical protein KC591_07210, partial [Gemmatimonadetes bacterium]|nr:hypothetical protein [Gemmatimonadota bacterium]